MSFTRDQTRFPKRLLFLCTGNYYRSRFAEALFNDLARRKKIPWQASSRGISTELGRHLTGPISPYAVRGLAERGIFIEEPARRPVQLNEDDLLSANTIIALYKPEHLPMLAQKFPDWVERVTFWEIPDLDKMEAESALAAVEQDVRLLVDRLSRNSHDKW